MIFRPTGSYLSARARLILGILAIFFLGAISTAFATPVRARGLSSTEESASNLGNGLIAGVKNEKVIRVSSGKKKSVRSPLAALIERRHFIIENAQRYSVHIEYPSLGFSRLDADLASWARQRANLFIAGLSDIPLDDPAHFILNITYERIQPSLRVCSIVFYITTDVGGISSEQGVVTRSYLVQEGSLLGLEDLFSSKGEIDLYTFLSNYIRQRLALRRWEVADPQWLHAGTRPDPVNFSLFAVKEGFLSLYFPPNQVAAASEGVIHVDIPLADLSQYKPNLALWGQTTPYQVYDE